MTIIWVAAENRFTWALKIVSTALTHAVHQRRRWGRGKRVRKGNLFVYIFAQRPYTIRVIFWDVNVFFIFCTLYVVWILPVLVLQNINASKLWDTVGSKLKLNITIAKNLNVFSLNNIINCMPGYLLKTSSNDNCQIWASGVSKITLLAHE